MVNMRASDRITGSILCTTQGVPGLGGRSVAGIGGGVAAGQCGAAGLAEQVCDDVLTGWSDQQSSRMLNSGRSSRGLGHVRCTGCAMSGTPSSTPAIASPAGRGSRGSQEQLRHRQALTRAQHPDGNVSKLATAPPPVRTASGFDNPVSAATRNCPETATKLPAGGHENCPLTVMGSARHDVVCLAAFRG